MVYKKIGGEGGKDLSSLSHTL